MNWAEEKCGVGGKWLARLGNYLWEEGFAGKFILGAYKQGRLSSAPEPDSSFAQSQDVGGKE
jgi:hypothetical protein